MVRSKSLIIWSIALVLFIWLSMVKYDTLATGGQAMEELVESFPKTLQAVFGMNGLNIATLEGYYGVVFLFIAIICAVFGGLLGASIVANEEIDKTTEFLNVKPRSRNSILSEKLLAALVSMVFFGLVIWLASLAATFKYAPSDEFVLTLAHFASAALIIMLLFGAFGLVASTVFKQPKNAMRVTAVAVAGSYFLYTFAKLFPGVTWLKYFSVFSWFDAKLLLDRLSFHPWPLIASSLLIIFFVVTAYATYSRRDLTA